MRPTGAGCWVTPTRYALPPWGRCLRERVNRLTVRQPGTWCRTLGFCDTSCLVMVHRYKKKRFIIRGLLGRSLARGTVRARPACCSHPTPQSQPRNQTQPLVWAVRRNRGLAVRTRPAYCSHTTPQSPPRNQTHSLAEAIRRNRGLAVGTRP